MDLNNGREGQGDVQARRAPGQGEEQRDTTQMREQQQVAPLAKGRGERFEQEGELAPDLFGSQESEILPGVWQHMPGLVTTSLQNLVNWGRQNSLWYFLFATACCGIELMAFGASKFDADRHGMVPWASPRQADVMIVAGTVNEKMGERIVDLYNQMAEPRYVIAMGACASNGGPFWTGYNVVDGVDKLIPVDVYVPGCPPRPEALLDAVYKLRAKIAQAGKRPASLAIKKPAGAE